MRTFHFLRHAAFCSLLGLSIPFMVSCGSSKNSQNSAKSQQNQVVQDVAVAAEPCDEYAMMNPVKRASGNGVHSKETTATNMAQLNARANLAKALQSMIEAATENYADGNDMFTAEEAESASITDQSAKVKDWEKGVAKEIVKGAPIVKKSRYRTANNQWNIYVCIELKASIAEMAAQVTRAFEEAFSPEQKARISFDACKFEESIKTEFKNNSGVTE